MPEGMTKLEKTRDNGIDCSVGSEAHYPWGTALNIENELVEDLGAEGLAAGDLVEIRAFAKVESKNEHQSEDGTQRSLRLQLTAMEIRRESSDRAETLYGDS